MQMLYNSDSYTVVQFELPAAEGSGAAARDGFEIVDKRGRRETFLDGRLAEAFQRGVQDLIRESGPNVEALDDYIGRFTLLAPQPLAVH